MQHVVTFALHCGFSVKASHDFCRPNLISNTQTPTEIQVKTVISVTVSVHS